jgi:hypothetical protein
MDVIGTLNGVIGMLKKARELAEQTKNLELRALIVELQGQLLDVKTECLQYGEEIENLKAENKRLSSAPEVRLKDGMYYRDEDGPFCTSCYDAEKKIIRLIG